MQEKTEVRNHHISFYLTEILHETAKAWKIRISFGTQEEIMWIPKSQCSISMASPTAPLVVTIPVWLYEDNNKTVITKPTKGKGVKSITEVGEI